MSEPNNTLRVPPEYLQVLAHYYRAEVYRSSLWRTRLDVTTNWAILAMTAAFGWAFTSVNSDGHIVFPITSFVVLQLLLIEARRYRFYDLWWTRARLLEGHLVVPALNPELKLLQGDWREFLSNDLLLPTFKIGFWEAMARRLANIYVYIFLILFGGWAVRVYTFADGSIDGIQDKTVSFAELLKACEYRFLHAGYTIGVQCVFLAAICAILFANWKGRLATGEIRRKDPNAPRWPV